MKEFTYKFLSLIKERITEEEFNSWFKLLLIENVDFTNKTITIVTPNNFTTDWIKNSYNQLIDRTFQDILKEKFNYKFKSTEKPSKEFVEENSLLINPDPFKIKNNPLEKGINPKYTFERFVVGEFNRFAHAAATAVAKNPGKSYNPLFIYSGVGLGKTHLLNSIGNYIFKNNNHLNVAYVTSEDFTNDLVKSIREDKMNEFRLRYRSIDILLIDDIQFIAGKQSTQEELFHTFNALYDREKQIVFTSDSSPKEITGLENRLKTRFEWGLIADIQTPDTETLVAIIIKKAQELEINLSNEIAFFLANNLPANIRTIEGSLTRLKAMADFEKVEISESFIRRILKDTLRIKEKDITVEYIIKVVGEFFGIKVNELKSKKKSKQIAIARQVAMYLSRYLTKMSYPHIGEKFGKDHSTVIHAENQIKKKIQVDTELNNKIKTIINIIKSNY
jgi:chromosomal replication initiator protein